MVYTPVRLSVPRTRKIFLKNVLFVLILLCISWLIIAQYLRLTFPSISGYLESGIDNGEPQVDVIQITNKIIGQKNLGKENEGYVFVVPKRIETKRITGIDIYNEVRHLVEILQSFREYDGATCHGFTIDSRQDHLQKLNSCWFETRNWTMSISGPNNKRNFAQKEPWLWICNMVEFPFIIRQNVFNHMGINQSYGEATLLDFFLRSNGTLKIAASQKCVFSKTQSKIDLKTHEARRQVYLDYGLLGHQHNILRIVRHDSITWTKCSYQNTSCPDIPEQESRINNIQLPYCCKTMLNQILIHTAAAMDQIGVEYRVGFGTVLGAIRTKTIIPWTQDADFCLTTKDSKTRTFEKLREALKPTKYAYAYLRDKHRIVPLYSLVKYISNHSLVKESDLFSEQALGYMQEMLPVPAPMFTRYPYADFYRYDKIFQRDTINITIDGLEYPTGDRPHELLREWFGSTYMSTDEKDRNPSSAVERVSLFQKIRRLFLI